METESDDRILALDVRPTRRMGYVVFEIPGGMIGWGIKLFSPDTLNRRTFELIESFSPSVVIVRNGGSHGTRRNGFAIRIVCRRASVRVISMRTDRINRAFGTARYGAKREIARIIATLFPEIRPRLPRPRKSWQSQNWAQPIFDAAGAALAYAVETRQIPLLTVESLRQPPNDVAN